MVERERERGHHTEYRHNCSLVSRALILATTHSQPSASASSTSAEMEGGLYYISSYRRSTWVRTLLEPLWILCTISRQPCYALFSDLGFWPSSLLPTQLIISSPFQRRCSFPENSPGKTQQISWGDLFPQAQKEKGNYIKNTFNHSCSVWLKEGKQKPRFMRQPPDPLRMIQAGRGSAIYTDWITLLRQREKDGIWSLLPERLSIWWLKTHQSCQAALGSLSGQGQ